MTDNDPTPGYLAFMLPILLLALGCAPHPAPPEPPTPPAPLAAPAVATLPTPYTAQGLHDALPAGAEIRYRIVEGGVAHLERWTFLDPTDTTVAVHTEVVDDAGRVTEDEGTHTARWDELRDHAKFPVEGTVRSDATVTVPAGTFTTWRYDVPDTMDDGTKVMVHYDFDPKRAGPPVRMLVEAGGVEVMTMELVSRTP